MDQGKSSSEMEDWIQELWSDFTGDMGLGKGVTDFPSSASLNSYSQQNGSAAAATSNNCHNPGMWPHQQSGFPPHQVGQNQAVVDHQPPPPNMYRFPMQSNSYATNHIPQRPVQGPNLTVGDQMYSGNQSQIMRLGGLHPLPESIPPPALLNPLGWVDEAYYQILKLKEIVSTEVLILYRRAQQLRQSATTPEAANHYERIRKSAEQVISIVRLSPADISRWPKEKVHYAMNHAIKFYKYARFNNAAVPQTPTTNGVRPVPQMPTTNGVRPVPQTPATNGFRPVPQTPATNGFRPENAVQLNNPVRSGVPSYQRLQTTGIDSRALGSFLLNSTRAENKPVADQAASKRQRSLERMEEKKPRRFAGLTGGQSLLVEGKDLSSASSSSKPPAVSVSASSSAFLSPMTPCSKPSDFAKSPLSVDESCRLPPNSSDPPLMKRACENLIVADEQNTDPVKRLVDADIYAVTVLSDRVATGFVHSGSTKVVLRDLADDVSKFRKQSAKKDQMETETGFFARGSAKRLKMEPRDFLLQEIKEINQRFMEVKVDVMNMDDISRMGFDGDILIRCSYIPVGPASQQMASKLLLELIVPAGYPNISPTVSGKMCPGCCDFEDGENLWTKAKSGFSLKLRKLGEPITVKQMARAWEDSAREVFVEYAERLGGGILLSSTRHGYGNWDSLAVAF